MTGRVKPKTWENPLMSHPTLLDALLDSWERNNTITVNLLRAIPDEAMDFTPADGSPSIARLFSHMDYVRLIFVFEDAPEFAAEKPKWTAVRDRDELARMLNASATAVRDAVKNRIETGGEMIRHYDHPLLMLQHLIWHEGYHHGQIKLTLKMAGRTLEDETIGPLTWSVWMKKTGRGAI
jgi:uncharacterized damage-inducible protein DinB